MRTMLFLLGLVATARADVGNHGYLPFGERAAMLGNAGLCSPFGEAVFYNPANLTRLDHPSLSVTGSTYLRYDLSARPLLVLDGQDQPFSASGFVAIPSTVTSTYRIGSWWLATAILVPEALDYKNRITLAAPDVHATVLQQQTAQSLWLGASVARKLGPHLALGATAFVAHETESSLSFVHVETAMATTEVTSNEDTSVVNLDAVAGLYWEPSPALGVGVRVQSPALRLRGTTDLYAARLSSAAGDTPGEVVVDGAKAARPAPMDLSIGVAFRPRSSVELVGDAGLQLPATIVTLDDPVAGTRSETLHLAPRLGLGAEIEALPHKWLRIGILYNRSAVAAPKTSDDPARDDYLGVTGGLSIQNGRTVTSIGAFLLESNTQLVVAGSDPPRLSDAHTRLYGGLLSFAYRL
jgi:hypothetical protein